VGAKLSQFVLLSKEAEQDLQGLVEKHAEEIATGFVLLGKMAAWYLASPDGQGGGLAAGRPLEEVAMHLREDNGKTEWFIWINTDEGYLELLGEVKGTRTEVSENLLERVNSCGFVVQTVAYNLDHGLKEEREKYIDILCQ